MWSLETLAQLNAKHAELGRDNEPVDARQVYSECGIRTLGSTRQRPVRAWYARLWSTFISVPRIRNMPPLDTGEPDVEALSAKLTAMGVAHRIVDPNEPRPDPPKPLTREDYKAALLAVYDAHPFMTFLEIAERLGRHSAWVSELIIEARRERDERLASITM